MPGHPGMLKKWEEIALQAEEVRILTFHALAASCPT